MFKEINNLVIFFNEPLREFHVREVAIILKITPATASKYLKNLRDLGILMYRKERMLDFYKANLDSEEYRDLKVYYNIRKLKESGLIEVLNKFYLKPTIILFGSSAQGLDTNESDVDLLIISEKTSEFSGIKPFEKKISRQIQLFRYNNLKNVKNRHLLNNMLNGIVLQGEIRWT